MPRIFAWIPRQRRQLPAPIHGIERIAAETPGLVPRGMALGATYQLPVGRRENPRRRDKS
jgi:hypothetical protein